MRLAESLASAIWLERPVRSTCSPPSSSGLGRRPFTPVARVRIPLGVSPLASRFDPARRLYIVAERCAGATCRPRFTRPRSRSAWRLEMATAADESGHGRFSRAPDEPGGVPRQPPRRPRDLDLRREGRRRDDASGVPERRPQRRPSLRRSPRSRRRRTCSPPDGHRQRRLAGGASETRQHSTAVAAATTSTAGHAPIATASTCEKHEPTGPAAVSRKRRRGSRRAAARRECTAGRRRRARCRRAPRAGAGGDRIAGDQSNAAIAAVGVRRSSAEEDTGPRAVRGTQRACCSSGRARGRGCGVGAGRLRRGPRRAW